MTAVDMCIYNGNHVVPIYQRNVYCEDRTLNISIFDFGDKLQVKVHDQMEYLFNYSQSVDMGDFEEMRHNQSLDINYQEFKTNIVEMLHQYQKKEMFLKCQLIDKTCTLVFYTKCKIKNMIYLTLELGLTDQSEIIAEMHSEIQELQLVNERVKKQLCKMKKIVEDKQRVVEEMEQARQTLVTQFFQNVRHIETLFNSKTAHIQSKVANKIVSLKRQITTLHQKVDVLKQENNLKVDSSDRLIKTMENLRLENTEYSEAIEKLTRENSSLNVLRVSLERNIADLKKSLEDNQTAKQNMATKQAELEKDLEKFSIVLTQKDSKINELAADLVQANNMLVQFNSRFDSKVLQVDELQQALQLKDKMLSDQKTQMSQILNSFEAYKAKFNSEQFEELKRDLFLANKNVHELEEERRKLNKLNALLSQKVSQGCFSTK